MKDVKSIMNKDREQLSEEASSQYWDDHDASKVLETGEQVELEVAKDDFTCPKCGSYRIRKRMIDLPLLNDTLILKGAKILFCADCKTSVIEKDSFAQLKGALKYIAKEIDAEKLGTFVKEGLTSYGRKWIEKGNERKVVSIYFPTREGVPAKAQISISVSDPLYPKIRSLTSEDVRNKLGLQHFEDLEREAQKESRSISQYLKLELAKRLLDGSLKSGLGRAKEPEQEAGYSNAKVHTLHIIPRTVQSSYLQKEQPYRLAAKSEEDEQIVLLETKNKEFIGVLEYDYGEGALFINIVRNNIGLSEFDAELTMVDTTVKKRQGLKVENKKVLLIPETQYTEDNVSEIILKMK